MKGLLIMHLTGGWVISTPGEEFTITAEKACIGQDCKPTGEIQIDERGFWILPSLDVDLRWASPTTVEIRKPRQTWVAGELTRTDAPGAAPPKAVVEQVTRWDRGVLPGLWSQVTDACKPDTKAWIYQPILTEAPARMVTRASGKPIVTEPAHLQACDDGTTQGVFKGAPKKQKKK